MKVNKPSISVLEVIFKQSIKKIKTIQQRKNKLTMLEVFK